MTAAEVWMLVAAVALGVAAAWARAAQTALSQISTHRLEQLAQDRPEAAARVEALLAQPARTVTLLALVVLAGQLTAVALVTTVALRHLLPAVALLLAVGATTVVLFIGAEVAAKTYALTYPERVAAGSARLVRAIVWPLSPLARPLIGAGNVVAPGSRLAEGPFVSQDELRELIDVAEEGDVIEPGERAMLHSIFDLGDTIVREIMVPRPDMVLVSAEDELGDVLETLLESGHSRLPVYREDRDTIVGLLYAKDVLQRLHAGDGASSDWADLLRPAMFVPELKTVDTLLADMQADKYHLAVVVDEYGATAGLVTIEDILEEIVGEIVDEYDDEAVLVHPAGDSRWKVDARLPVSDLNELLDTHLPDDEWDTVGGLLFGMLGHVPATGEQVEADTVRLTAERVANRRIAEVLVEQLDSVTDPAAEHTEPGV